MQKWAAMFKSTRSIRYSYFNFNIKLMERTINGAIIKSVDRMLDEIEKLAMFKLKGTRMERCGCFFVSRSSAHRC
jgi:hypothetical protein